MDARIWLCAAVFFLLALWLLYREGLMRSPLSAAVLITTVGLSLLLRLAAFDYETLDYKDFLRHWVEFFRVNGGFAALDTPVGNYNIPYLYFLAFFSYLDINDLHLIKLLSVFFDFVLAWSCMRLVGKFTDSPLRRGGSFCAVLLWPTVFLNGAVWGQCDSSYVALMVLGIYLALDDRPVLSMVCAALSFGFKLQAVFLLPVYAVLWMQGRFRLRHFVIFPLSYVLLVMPAVIAGRPFMDTLTLYLGQTGSIGSGLNYNSPSAFSFFQYTLPESYHELACKLGIAAAFTFMLCLLLICYVNRKSLNDRAVLAAALLFAIGIPFLLPHMHDRYFFGADMLSLVLAFVSPVCAAAALCVEFASFLGYHAYLKMEFLLLMDRGAWALLAALLIAACCLAFQLSGRGRAGVEKLPENPI